MSVKITNLQEFKFDVEKFKDFYTLQVRDILRLAGLKIFKGVVEKTPVDKGIARGSWVIAVGVQPKRYIEAQENLSKERIIARSKVVETNTQPFTTIFISNYVPYIWYLEHGSSSQAPQGMASVTLTQVAAELRSGAL